MLQVILYIVKIEGVLQQNLDGQSHNHVWIQTDCNQTDMIKTRNSDIVVSFSTDFPSNSKGDAPVYHITFDLSSWGRCSMEDIFQLWVQVRIDAQSLIVNIKLSLTHLCGFQLLVLLTLAHKNRFFHLHQKNKSSESKVKFRWEGNCCKRVLEAGKLGHAN